MACWLDDVGRVVHSHDTVNVGIRYVSKSLELVSIF